MAAFLESIGYNTWVLPALLLLPLIGGVAVAGTGWAARAGGETADGNRSVARHVALVVLILEFVVSLGLWWSIDPAGPGWQATFDRPWIGVTWNAHVSLGVDGIAVAMILLTTFLMPLTVLGSWTSIRTKEPSYYALLLILTTGMLGVFMALDLLFFYVMWEVMLIPMYFIIGVWGGERRLYASIKFFVYTMLGSLLMLVAIIYLYRSATLPLDRTSGFSYDYLLANARITETAGLWLFGAFFLAFAIKVPMFPFHTWLPDAHVEAPTAGSVILAGIMLKMGTFGFLRYAVPFFPHAAMHPTVRAAVVTLAVIGIVYGALVAMVQPDFKKLVAYSSVSHLGFVMLGIFSLTIPGVQGALMIMINHGISTGALFFLVGIMYERKHSRMIDAYGGIARVVPLFAVLLTLVAFSSIGVPGTNGFIGEFLVLIGAFRSHPVAAIIAATGVIFAAAYLLWAIQRVLFNPLDKPANALLPDLNRRELALMLPLVAAILWLGVYPGPLLKRMEPAAGRFISTVNSRLELPLGTPARQAPR